MDVFSCANLDKDDLWINVNMSIIDFKSLTFPNCELLNDQVDFEFLVFKCNLLHVKKICILKEDMLINISLFLFHGLHIGFMDLC
jgi:hypothetical protein